MDTEDRPEDELDTLVEQISRIIEHGDEKLYSKEVLREFRNPSQVGRMPDADAEGIADGLCGDTMEFYLKIRSRVVDMCTFYTDGCGATIACGNRLARLVIGKTVDDAMSIKPSDLISLLNGLPEAHEHCASLAVIALRNAIRNYGARAEGVVHQ